MEVHVLRLGHRAVRDKRVTTHLALVARAFGAAKILISGTRDKGLETSIQRVVHSWGGRFSLKFVLGWSQIIKEYKDKNFKVVHLTMYGLPVQDNIERIKRSGKLVVIVGGEKVPSDVYQMADYNIAVTNQPHSEISALAVFLDRLLDGTELEKNFENAKQVVFPQAHNKQILRLK